MLQRGLHRYEPNLLPRSLSAQATSLPDKEFRYLRTIRALCSEKNTSFLLLIPIGSRELKLIVTHEIGLYHPTWLSFRNARGLAYSL